MRFRVYSNSLFTSLEFEMSFASLAFDRARFSSDLCVESILSRSLAFSCSNLCEIVRN
jgi:hypothetical protein